MLTKLEGKYIGEEKIKSTKKVARKTYLDSEVYEVVLENKEVVEYPASILDAINTDKPVDLNELRELKGRPIAKKILSIFVDSEIAIEDINYLLQSKLPATIQESIGVVYKKYWGKNKEDVTLRDVDLKLKLDK